MMLRLRFTKPGVQAVAPGLKAELIGGCAVNNKVVTLAEGCKISHR